MRGTLVPDQAGDLAGYDPDDVRTVIDGCAQDPHIFDTTIRDNLRLAQPGPARPGPARGQRHRTCRRRRQYQGGSYQHLTQSGGAFQQLWQPAQPAERGRRSAGLGPFGPCAALGALLD
jgi:hypothetical protein